LSVSLITGLPRHGKSYYAVLQCLEELRRSERYVVTNLPLDLAELQSFCDQWIEKFVDVSARVRVLSAAETAEFWLYDPGGDICKGNLLFKPEVKEWQRSLKPRREIYVPDFSSRQHPGYPGCLAVIDEAHIFFDSHHWQEIGTDCSYFISQHGHLRYDIMFITQHPSKLAKRLKVDLEEWTVVTNLGKVKQWQGVTLPGWFMRQTYAGSPDDPQPGIPETGRFCLKAETVGKLYSTSAGVGLSGRVDTEEKKVGKHWSRAAVVCGVGLVLAIVLPLIALKSMGALVNKGLGGYLGETTGLAKKGAEMVGAPASTSAPPSMATALGPRRFPAVMRERPELPGITGFVGGLMVCLDNGQNLECKDGYRFTRVPEGVYVEGMGVLKWSKRRKSPSYERPVESVADGDAGLVRGFL